MASHGPASAALPAGGGLDDLIQALRAEGRRVVGPVVEDGALKMTEIERAAELPFGWTARLEPGWFGWSAASMTIHAPGARSTTGPRGAGSSPWTFPARVDALSVETRADGSLAVRVEAPAAQPIAVIGARACDLAALGIHDRVLAGGPAVDPDYAARRAELLIVAVECAFADLDLLLHLDGHRPRVHAGRGRRPGGGRWRVRGARRPPAGERLLERWGRARGHGAHR